MVDTWKDKIYAYALKNAMDHGGKAMANSVLAHLFQEGLDKSEIKKIMPLIQESVKIVNSMKKTELEKEFAAVERLVKKIEHKEREGLQELPNVKGQIVLRLAPFPSGAMHIGNAKTYLLNALYVEKYHGKLLFVIDDTIGSKEKQIMKDAYNLLPEAFDWLKVQYEKPILYKSDRLDIYYKHAEKIINLGKAYVCSCVQEKLRENREKGIECACRQYPAKEQMKRWKEMFSAKEGACTLRIKTSMQDKNPAFRDRVLFRISDMEHPRVGKKYRVWPLLEFSWAIDDVLLGITHVIRGKDLMIESDMEKFIWNIFGWKGPELIHGGMVKIAGIEAKISKSKAQQEVKSGRFTGWDDPRTWSVQSLKRRGFLPEAVREFIEKIGLNQNDIAVPIDSLYAINRKLIDETSDRYSFVQEPIEIEVKKKPAIAEVEVKVHPEQEKRRKIILGEKLFISSKDYEANIGKEVRLMNLYNLKLGKSGKCEFTSEHSKNIDKDLVKINWVSNFSNVRILMPDGLWVGGIADDAIKSFEEGREIQFERFGFARYDRINEAGEYEFWFSHR